MQFVAASPERNDEVSVRQDGEMFSHGLAGHIEVLAELAQGLAVVHMELVKQRPPGRIGQSFKDIIHVSMICN